MPGTNAQQGIVNRPPEHALVAALSFTGQPTPQAAMAAVQQLQGLVQRELAADIDEVTSYTTRTAAFTESGELGVTDGYDTCNLTITFGVGATGMTSLGVPQAEQPQDLIQVPWSEFGDSPANQTNGDIVLQICSDNAYVVEHVLRRIEVNLAGTFNVVWTLLGEQRYGLVVQHSPTTDSPRALIGFNDGLSNLDPTDPDDAALIFVDPTAVGQYPPTPSAGAQPPPSPGEPGYGPGVQGPTFPTGLRNPPTSEPAWTTDGTYMFVRASLLNMANWDQTTLGGQEQAIGRWKDSGATLDNPDQTAHRDDPPQFATNPANVAVPPNSHIRRANPRQQANDALRRILRRGYPLISAEASGTLQRGLVFISFGRTLSSQVEFILAAWLKNPNFPVSGTGIDPLLNFEASVVAGGYFFVPPLQDPAQPWSWVLPPQS